MKIDTISKLGLHLWCWTLTLLSLALAENVFDAIGRNDRLTKFKGLVDRDEVVRVVLQHRTATVFAPTDDAFNKLSDPRIASKKGIASYHVAGILAERSLFPLSTTTLLTQAAPLYCNLESHDRHSDHHHYHKQEHFVNNAKILQMFEYSTSDGTKQFLYIIDEVLEPFAPKAGVPPTTFDLLTADDVYGLSNSGYDLRLFGNKIREYDQEALYSRPGNHTFFIPTVPGERFREVDSWVVRGHVIPNNVLFTRTVGSAPYRSDVFEDNIHVEVAIVNRSSVRDSDEGSTFYAQSNTLQADKLHNKGIVMSRIIKGNIPVKNGVVHLIDKPLMIVDISLWDFIELEKNNRLSTFYELINHVPGFRNEILSGSPKTILAPTNKAFETLSMSSDLEYIKRNMTNLKLLLDLHLVRQSVSSDDVRSNKVHTAPSLDPKRGVLFRVSGDDKNRILSVEGGGVNAEAVEPDIGATNGIIHIIDRVLGMPFQTVKGKLATDPDMSDTNTIGANPKISWNEELDDSKKKFTYFVPSNKAWEGFRDDNPSEYKQLVEGIYPHHAKPILDRHLIVNERLTIKDLEDKNGSYIQTRQGKLKVVIKDGNIYVEWEGIQARISRPDVEAVNGVIHVIDKVLMLKRDLTVAGSSTITVNLITLIITSLIAKLLI